MNLSKIFIIFVLITSFFIIGCSSTPVQYSFANNENEAASIIFTGGNPGLRLVYFDGMEFPQPRSNTYWDPILFPSGRPLRMTVHASFNAQNAPANRGGIMLSNRGIAMGLSMNLSADTNSVSCDVVFECPPLDAGGSYRLTFRRGSQGKDLLVLTNDNTGRIVHEQEFIGIRN
ncbi:MAG: hypothetical protein FWD47_15060 [Treponema sp.]|nr:hypothetical protein [Treponema sp.]